MPFFKKKLSPKATFRRVVIKLDKRNIVFTQTLAVILTPKKA